MPNNGDETNKQPKTQDVEKLLSDEISHHWKVEPLEAAGLSQEILNFWEEAGILIKYEMRGQKIFAFRHLTFQEYSVSRVLADMPPKTVWDKVQKNISSPQWREAILLTLAQLDMQTCTQFIRQLLDEDATDRVWHQRLNMAGNLLAEGAALSEPVRRTTIDRLIKLAQLRLPWSVDEINAATLFQYFGQFHATIVP